MSRKKAWTVSVAASILLVGLVFVGLFGTGYRFFVVQTPSMATVAPVGTLVAVHPESSYQIGELVSYGRGGKSYTHRIVGQTWQGWTLKGDLNATPDALPVANSQIIGKVVFIGKYLGFAVNMLPWIAAGCALVFLLTLLPRFRRSWRWPARLIGSSLVVSLVWFFQRPWVNLVMLGYVPDDTAGVDMHLVNTGIFPVSVLGTVLQSGQDAVVNQTVADSSGHYYVSPHLALTLGWFLGMVALCLVPMMISILARPAADVVDAIVHPHNHPVEAAVEGVKRFALARDVLPPAAAVLLVIVAVSLVLQGGTQSAYAARITNSTNTAGTRIFFKCQDAETKTSGARFVWGLTAAGTQTDLDASATDPGTMTTVWKKTAAAPDTTAPFPCVRDTAGGLKLSGATCFTSTVAVTTPGEAFSEEIWFKTTPQALNGKLMGLADTNDPTTQSHYDRHVYIDASGRLVFGVYVDAQVTTSSPTGVRYDDGNWHHMVATSATGMIILYVDGVQRGSTVVVGTQDKSYTGHWQVGCGLLDGWVDASGVAQHFGSYFTGSVRLAAVYDKTLTQAQVTEHYLAGRP